MTIEETIAAIRPLDQQIMEKAKKRWDSIAKPLHSLGKMEDLITQIVGITGNYNVDIHKKALVAMCADNGVVEEGVTQTGQEVTAIVADNFVRGTSTVCVMCQECGVDMKPVDIGMVTDALARTDLKVAYGTQNMAKGPAMTREQAEQAIQAGISMAEELKSQGYQILATGEMGIGNTTTSSAVASVLLGQPVEKMTGRGAGLSSEGLLRKIHTIEKAIQLNMPDPEDPVDVLAKVGTVVFDKTGTLTCGQFAVTAVHPDTCDEHQLLHLLILQMPQDMAPAGGSDIYGKIILLHAFTLLCPAAKPCASLS